MPLTSAKMFDLAQM